MPHTPGPWTWYGNKGPAIVAKEGRVCLLELHHWPEMNQPDEFHEDRRQCNARLIAAAPELLAACIEMELFLRVLGLDSEPARQVSELAKSAIAKAKGK